MLSSIDFIQPLYPWFYSLSLLGCNIGGLFMNVPAYAYDNVLLGPSRKALRQLLINSIRVAYCQYRRIVRNVKERFVWYVNRGRDKKDVGIISAIYSGSQFIIFACDRCDDRFANREFDCLRMTIGMQTGRQTRCNDRFAYRSSCVNAVLASGEGIATLGHHAVTLSRLCVSAPH